jgi:hypothetical protein
MKGFHNSMYTYEKIVSLWALDWVFSVLISHDAAVGQQIWSQHFAIQELVCFKE